MRKYESLFDAIDDLEQKGYHHNFHLENDSLYSPTLRRRFGAHEIFLTGYYRFEGMSYPGDNDIVFTVKTIDGYKGLLVCPYGVYSDSTFMPALAFEHQDRLKDGQEN